MHPFYNIVTDRARKIFEQANVLTKKKGNSLVTNMHILVGLLEDDNYRPTSAIKILKNLGVDVNALKAEALATIPESGYSTYEEAVPYAPDAQRLICNAIDFGWRVRHVGSYHILCALLTEQKNPAFTLLKNKNITRELVQANLRALFKPNGDKNEI